MNENQFKSKITKKFDGWIYATADPHRTGVPDLTGVYEGRAVWWELKYIDAESPSESFRLPHKVSAPQTKYLRETADHGAWAGVLIGFSDDQVIFLDGDDLPVGPVDKVSDFSTLDLDEFLP